MIFNTPEYYALLVLAAVTFRSVTGVAREWAIILSGAAFFVHFSITSVGGPIGACCLGIFLWEAIFSRLYAKGSSWCIWGVVQALVILFVFKYWNFAVQLVMPHGRAPEWTWQGAFLPLGISFFTFEFIHYAVDRHQGRAERGTFTEYLSFILFFPTMVAGPIKRFQDFMVTLRDPSTAVGGDFFHGITRILVGLAKKLAIADVLTALTDHLNSNDVANAPRWVLLVWLFAYGIKIYVDFSAYSDIAIGSARLFGLVVKENFDWPYFQPNIAEFWKHWHISLYRWLVDYLFIPLGGSRMMVPLVVRNILLTMLISGLWHGASLNFVAWGLYHGGLLVGHRLWNMRRGPAEHSDPRWRVWLNTLGTYIMVNLGWGLFCMDLPTTLLFFRRLVFG
jgi:alginate O-acetyltransferase complex protein AlgI